MGHGTLPYTACTRGLVVAFLNDPDSPLDTSCLAELPPITFITDLHIAPEIGLALVIRGVVVRNPYVLGFGIPGSAAPLLRLPWLFVTFTAGVVVLAALAWRRRWWSRFGGIHYSLVAAACVSFALLLTSHGFL